MGADLFAAIAGRRSIRRFSPRPVEMDKVLQCVQAGALAPSSGNIQNWCFIILTETQRIRNLYPLALEQEPFLTASVAVIVCGDVEYAHTLYGMRGKRLYTIQNCAAATQNILLAAHALGLGAVWIGAFDEDRVAAMFEIPHHEQRPQAILLLGYAAEEPEARETKPLHSIIYLNRFGNRVLRPHLIYYDWATEWRLEAQKAKAHLQHLTQKLPSRGKGAEGKDAAIPPSPAKEQRPAEQGVRRRLAEAFDGMKKEGYRRRQG